MKRIQITIKNKWKKRKERRGITLIGVPPIVRGGDGVGLSELIVSICLVIASMYKATLWFISIRQALKLGYSINIDGDKKGFKAPSTTKDK